MNPLNMQRSNPQYEEILMLFDNEIASFKELK